MITFEHPNRAPFGGVLTLVDVASDKPPTGARGHRVILTREAAEGALEGLCGMGVNYRDKWDGHDNRCKVGVIETAWIVGRELRVEGYLYALDFPEVVATVRRTPRALGMSYELHRAQVEDMRRSIWTLTSATFTGAAILMRTRAAYRKTSFGLVGEGRGLALAAVDTVDLRSVPDECDEESQEGCEAEEVPAKETGKALCACT